MLLVRTIMDFVWNTPEVLQQDCQKRFDITNCQQIKAMLMLS
jgi:hypothetical protein